MRPSRRSLGVDRIPMLAGHEPWLTLAQPVSRGLCRWELAAQVVEVGQQVLDGRVGALLVRADDPVGAALDPTRDVLALPADDATLIIRDQAA